MRKTLGICVAASVALWLSGCGDDDSVCISCDTEDSATTDTTDDTESDTDETSSTGNTSSTQASSTGDEGDSGTITIEAGSSETPDGSAVDAGGVDSGTDAEAPSTDDGGALDAGDAGPVEESDAGDGGGSSLTPCAQACETALLAECEDNSTCEFDLCIIRDIYPDCADEADAYFLCIAETNHPESFVCDAYDKPQYDLDRDGEDCEETYFSLWLACSES